ncbi:MAG: hypothetical protein M3494_02385 [Actinomycetota bacterium]|nr:hypothetical protein [Rubrobacter sp.]MDQ3506855.1 hypothetical protein [Actinomycetota bacterium]
MDKLTVVETKETRDEFMDGHFDEDHEMPGLGRWVKRNVWLLVRLFMVLVFTFGTTLIADQFSYGLQEEAVELSVEEVNNGELPAGLANGDYVRITGTPDVGENLTPENVGGPESEIGISTRYSVAYFYFLLEDTGDNLMIQTAQGLPDFDGEEMVWEGKFSTLGTVIFFGTTSEGLEVANLPTDQSIPVIETGDTPAAYRDLFPAYSSVIVVWVVSILWLMWKRNKPFV